MGLDDTSRITVVFGKAAKIFGEDYRNAPDPVAATDPTKMEVANPVELDALMDNIATLTGLNKSEIKVNDGGKSIRFVGEVKVFDAFLNASTHEHHELGRLKQDDPEGILGRKGDKLYTLDLHAAHTPSL